MSSESKSRDIRSLWDFSDPSVSRIRFEKIIEEEKLSSPHPLYLELISQIVRTHGLERDFEQGHQLLDDHFIDFDQANSRVKVNYHLERGRLFNSNNNPEKALNQFYRAWDLAKTNNLHFLAVDAAHMIAIANPDQSLEWNLQAIDYAEQSGDEIAKQWLGSLYNNTGWNYFENKDYNQALELFEKALQFHISKGNTKNIQIARWTIGRVYRELGRFAEALELMHALEEEEEQDGGQATGYTYEELGELYHRDNNEDKARVYFGKAYEILSQDEWFVLNESQRLDRIHKLASSE